MKCLAAAPLLVLFALLAPAGHAAAREPFVLHVAPNGDDEGAGTKDAPFASIHHGS